MQVNKQNNEIPALNEEGNEQNGKASEQSVRNVTKDINDYNAIITCPCCKGTTEITSIDQLARDDKIAKEVDDFKNQSTSV